MSSSLAPQPTIQERRPAPSIPLSLSSNNPFLRRASPGLASPGLTSPPIASTALSLSPPLDEERRAARMSTNPFLDNYQPPPRPVRTAGTESPREAFAHDGQGRRDPTAARTAAEQLNGLVLNDRPAQRPIPDRSLKTRNPQHRGAAMPIPPAGHRPRGSDEARRIRKDLLDSKQSSVDVFSVSPDKKENKRPIVRRNSDTSIIEFKEDERKQKDARARDPEGRSRRPKKSNRQVDLIDKLDVTGVFGAGMFHHDGPFDACNPHRNRKGHRAAPMQAFAEGSLNNAIGGSGPVHKNIDLDRIHGRGVDGFDDYNSTTAAATQKPPQRRPLPDGRARKPQNFRPDYRQHHESIQIDDPKGLHMLHGEETAGLGTSTFLEGAPVPRSALQRRESENEAAISSGGGLTRKKSLAQKMGLSRQRPDFDRSAIVPSPEGRYTENGRTLSPRSPQYTQSAGGRAKMNEANPFFADGVPEEAVPEKKEATVQIVDPDQAAFSAVSRTRTNSSPPRGILRRALTNDNTSLEQESKTGGLLSRMKSLKSGRRPERHEQKASA